MIVKWLFGAFLAFIDQLVKLLPTDGPPSWWAGASDKIATVWGYASGLGAWLPYSTALTVAGGCLVVAAIGFTIKVIRIVASFLTAGGGSAA